MNHTLALALLIPLSASAATFQIECPASLAVKSTATAPSGWQTAQSPQPHGFDHVGLYRGNPADLQASVPETAEEKQGRSKDVWRFDATEKMWVACFYTGTSLFIAQPVSPGATRCEALYGPSRRGAKTSLIAAHCE